MINIAILRIAIMNLLGMSQVRVLLSWSCKNL